VLADIEPSKIELMLSQLGRARENLRRAIDRNGAGETRKPDDAAKPNNAAKVKRYG
jgi:hypothetical protein